MKLTSIVRLVSLLLLGGLTGRAQSNVSVTFQTLQLNSIPAKLAYSSGGQYITVAPAYRYITTAQYAYSGNSTTMGFFVPTSGRGGSGAGSGGAPTMKQVGSVTFPATSGKFLVLINNLADGTITANAVTASTDSFPTGSVRFVNATGLPIIASCNEQHVPVAVSSSTTYKGINTPNLALRALFKKGDKELDLKDAIQPNIQSDRTWVFVTLNNAAAMKADHTIDPGFSMDVFQESPNGDDSGSSPGAAPTTSAGMRRGTAGTAGTGGGRRGRSAGTSGNSAPSNSNSSNQVPPSDDPFGPTPASGG